MGKKARKVERRDEKLSRERIVEVTIELLDAEGQEGLTFRTLAARLATGAGAIYWHVTNKDELLVAASDAIVSRALSRVRPSSKPEHAIRAIAVQMFDAIDAHAWVGAQLAVAPWTNAMLSIFERIGRELQAMNVPRKARFTSASVLVSYIVGVSAQNAMNGRMFARSANRSEVLAKEAARWKELDAREYAFTRSVADRLREHDDRDELVAGVDLILDGIHTRV